MSSRGAGKNEPWVKFVGGGARRRRRSRPLANPAGVLPAWRMHATRHGRTPQAGTVVTTGAWGGLHPVRGAAHGALSIEGLGELAF